MLITHRGLSGPAILQISSYWQMQEYSGGNKQPIDIDLLPGTEAASWLAERSHNKAFSGRGHPDGGRTTRVILALA